MIQSLVDVLGTGSWDSDSGVHACWLPEGKYVLYLVSVDAVPGLRADTDDICQRFDTFILSPKDTARDCYREMKSLKWVNSASLITAYSARKVLNSWSFAVFQTPPIKVWLQDTVTTCSNEARRQMISNLRLLAAERKEGALKTRMKAQRKIWTASVPEPMVSETDLVVLPTHCEEYTTVLSKLTSPLTFPAACVKKCIVDERRKRFDAYRLHNLPTGHQEVRIAFHGTPQVSSANSIARNGPDFTKAGSNVGTALGCGFYTSSESVYPESIAKSQGSLLVLSVAPGRMFEGNGSVATLAESGHDSVTTKGNIQNDYECVCQYYIL